MNQPKRLLTKSRKYASRPSLSASSSEGDGWISAHPKTSDNTSLDDSSSDDGKLDLLGKRRSLGTAGIKPGKRSTGKDKTALFESDSDSDSDDGRSLGRKGGKQSGNPIKGSTGKKSWNDGSNSDDDSAGSSTIHGSSSGDSSDNSVEEVKKTVRKRGDNKRSVERLKRPAMQPKKREGGTKKQTISRSSLNRVRNAGVRERTTPCNAPRREVLLEKINVARLAETKASQVAIPEDITKVAQLKWYCMRLSETRERLVPCRVLSKGGAAKHRGVEKGKQTKVIHYLTLNGSDGGKCKCVDDSLLIPMGYTSKDGLSTTFNDDYLQRYMEKESKTTSSNDLEAMRAYIKRVFDHAREAQKRRVQEKANRDPLDFYESSSDEDDDPPCVASGRKGVQFDATEKAGDDSDDEGDELEVPYTQAITFDPDDFDMGEERSNEPLRSGDIIEYYSPIFVAGDSRGLRQATVLAVRPKDETALVLSNGEVLPNDTKVKRIKVKSGRELVEHSGIFRPIDRFRLIKGGSATAADAVAKETDRFQSIMQKNAEKMKEKAEADGFAPMDMLVSFKGSKAGAASAKSTSRSNALNKQSGRKQHESSQSSTSDDNSSDDEVVNKRQAPKLKAASKESAEMSSPSGKLAGGKENSGNTSGTAKTKLSLGSLSSSASLGSSLASSDDSSGDELVLDLGKNHSKLTQHVPSASPKGKRAKATSRTSGVSVFDLSHSSDEDKKNSTKAKRNNPLRKDHSAKLQSPDKSISSQSSLETPASPGLKKKQTGKKPIHPSNASSADASKLRLEFGKAPQSIGMRGIRGSAAKASNGRKASPSLPCSSSSEDSSPSPSWKQRGNAAGAKSTGRDGLKKKLVAKKRSSPSSGSSSSDDSDDDILAKPNKCSKSNARKQVDMGPPTRGREASISVGWTQETNAQHTFGGAGFSFRRVKKKDH